MGADQVTNHGPTAAEVYARTGNVEALAAALRVGELIPAARR